MIKIKEKRGDEASFEFCVVNCLMKKKERKCE